MSAMRFVSHNDKFSRPPVPATKADHARAIVLGRALTKAYHNAFSRPDHEPSIRALNHAFSDIHKFNVGLALHQPDECRLPPQYAVDIQATYARHTRVLLSEMSSDGIFNFFSRLDQYACTVNQLAVTVRAETLPFPYPPIAKAGAELLPSYEVN